MGQRIREEIEILLVEDNPGDVRLAQEALRDLQTRTTLHVAKDGEEALSFLKTAGSHHPPDLIILDLNLPRKDGREVLADIKTDPSLRHIPVVIHTTSSADRDVKMAYDLHANCFITKAVDLNRSYQAMKSIEAFWLKTVTLPPQSW